MTRRRNIAAACASLALSASALACVPDGDGPAPIVLRAQTADVTFESAFPAELDLALGSNASAFTFSAAAASDRGVWSIRATLTREQVFAGAFNLEVGSSALSLASAQIQGSTRLQAESGKLDVTFGRGTASGTVTMASPEILDGSFSGSLGVSCLVPLSALPADRRPPGGTNPTDGSEPLTLDPDFVSAPCVPFQIVR